MSDSLRAGKIYAANPRNSHGVFVLLKIGKRPVNKANREDVAAHFPDPRVRKTIVVDVSLIDHYDQVPGEMELDIPRSAKVHNVQRKRLRGSNRSQGSGRF